MRSTTLRSKRQPLIAVPKERADTLLLSRGLCDSREQAKRLILAGEVRSGDHLVPKASSKLEVDAPLSLKEKPRYVSRGGLKMEGALEQLKVNPEGRTCLDIGASTGGFTDCLLQHGARKVHAIDVGTNQLVWKIRNDPRVEAREKFNARHLELKDLGESVSLIVIDVSFISLTKILPAAFKVLDEGGEIIPLIKPQFELERDLISKGGIVKDPDLHQRAVDKIRNFVESEMAREWRNLIESPIKGTDGNKEFLAHLL